MKKHFLLPILILISSLILAAAGIYLKYGLLKQLQLETKENIISLPFVLFADDQFSYRFHERLDAYLNPTESPIQDNAPATEATQPTKTEDVPPETAPVPSETQPIPAETEATQPLSTVLDESWFDDALFIGESRFDGLKNTARLGEAEYFTSPSVTVFGLMFVYTSDNEFGKQNLEELLSTRTYGKIFIHLGINECGAPPDDFADKYQAIIERIQFLQPDAHIILHSIVPVTPDFSPYGYYGPANLALFNKRIMAMANGENIHYLDASEWCADEEGYLRKDLTNDGCHPHGLGYQQWAQWLLDNCGKLGIP